MATEQIQFPPFDPDSDPTTVGARFKKYVERFKNYIIAIDVKEKPRQRALFLHCAGFKVQDIFDTLEDTGEDFETASKKLIDYFEPEKHKLYNIYQFRQLSQEADELYDDYCTRLKQAAKACDFPEDWIETEILLQIIDKGKSKRVRRRLLSRQHTLKEAMDFARAHEIADNQAKKIERAQSHEQQPQSYDVELNKVMTRQNNVQENKKTCLCFNCGGSFPHDGGMNKCPAKGKKCMACQKYNHFARCCRSKQKSNIVKTVQEQFCNTSSESSDAESLNRVEVVGAIEIKKSQRPVRSIKIDNHKIDVLIDTGSTANVMDQHTYKNFFSKQSKLKKTNTTMQTYSTDVNPSSPLKVIGKFDTVIESKSKVLLSTFYVVKGNTKAEPLLSYRTAEDLELIHVVNEIQDHESKTNELLKEYADCFEGIGKMRGVKVDLHIDQTIKPVAQNHRRIPFSVREKLEQEIKRLEEEDIIEKVNKPTGWVSPAVITPKKNNNIRLNVDMRVANEAIPRTNSVMPTVEEVIHGLNGSTVFSHLDMNHGYHQLELQENSRDITTFSTHMGLYRYKRLNYGTKSAGEIFQEKVHEEITQLIPKCINISDDILVHGKTQEEHDQNLRALFKKSREKGITFNKEKCEFNKDSCLYYGLVFSKHGVSPDPKKVSAIKCMKAPQSTKELNSFLCTVQYNSRFLDRYSQSTNILRELNKAKHFVWNKEHQIAFDKLKEALCAESVLAYFDPKAEHEVHVDGCPLGISATLVQRKPKQDFWQVIQYASRSLTDSEKRYSQIELEMLAADFGCKKFHMYLYGMPFTIITDHKPLEVIFNNPRHQTSIRLQRIMVHMMDYNFTVKYKPGKDNISDYMSRHPLAFESCSKKEMNTTKDTKQYVNFVVTNAIPKAVTKEELMKATDEDAILQNLKKCIQAGKIERCINVHTNTYKKIFNELSIVDGLILRGERIVIPFKLQDRLIKIAHEGHQGIVRTKQLLRAHVWFPGMDSNVAKHVGKCLECQATTSLSNREPIQATELPKGPWIKISADFVGPFPNKDMIFVMWDQYSRYPVVEFLSSTSADAVIPKMKNIFYTYGIPEEIKTDNGPPFNGKKFNDFAIQQGFNHRKVTPRWAEANGDVERFMQTIKKSAKIATIKGLSIRQEIIKTIGMYRATPHPNTGTSPNQLIFGREIKGKFPSKIKKCEEDRDIRERDYYKKLKMKEYADKKRHTSMSNIKIGNNILIKKERKNMLSPLYDPKPYKVIGVKGSMITAIREGVIITRNSSHCKLLKHMMSEEEDDFKQEFVMSEEEDDWEPVLDQEFHNENHEFAQPFQDEQEFEMSQTQQTIEQAQETEYTQELPRRSNRNRVSTKQTVYKDFINY